MSIVETYRKDFSIFCYDEDLLRSSNIQEFLQKQNFNFTSFNSRGLFLETIKTQLPHVLLLYYQPMSVRFREILDEVRKQSAEVEVIVLGSNEFWPGINHLIKSGLVDDFWSWPVASESVVGLRLEKIIEKTIYKYIAEQRSDETRKIVEQLEDQKQLQRQVAEISGGDTDLGSIIGRRFNSENQLLEALFDQLKSNHPQAEFVYFKNYQAKNQLLVTRTSFSSDGYFRGQSVPFNQERLSEDRTECFNGLRDLIGETFNCSEFIMQPVELAEQFFGIIMAVHMADASLLQKTSRYLSVSLRNIMLENGQSRVKEDSQIDNVIRPSQLLLQLSSEVSRARRLKTPVSLIIGHIDFIGEDNEENKRSFEIIQQELRAYDFVTLRDDGRIVMIMPHCAYEDAAIKAESIRRKIVARGLRTQNTPLRLCFGVSEFPSLSEDSDALMQDAEQACNQVFTSGKNKVCLYTAKESHQPEFTTQHQL